jgi:hypothetical protein
MTQPWLPPRPTYYLRIFGICLVILILSLAAFLFAVRLEAVAPATGIIKARNQVSLRPLSQAWSSPAGMKLIFPILAVAVFMCVSMPRVTGAPIQG